MTTDNTTTPDTAIASVDADGVVTIGDRAKAEDAGTFIFGGRKRKDGPAFTKIERAIIFANLPIEAQRFVIRYGVRQYASDGAASAKDQEAFEAGIDARIENLANADFNRKAGDGPAPTNDPEKLADQYARQAVAEALKAAKMTVAKEQRDAAVATYRTANAAALVAKATADIASRRAAGAAVDLASLGIVIPT